ncbi:BatD family protein [Pseudomonas citronellolis]|uniref:BatD family protein n=1 Tax=Pseudomonas citronellolis TaxID=53408 RepID=UPI0023E3F16F|nr:BatD family protein [Pseudomonas citronellolis]MDF3935155.1 BatD family protein [Pseudomonas citronellolis]
MKRLICLLLLSLAALQAEASLTASVDRASLAEGESVDLTLESDDPTQFGKPDLAPLDEAFEVLATRQVNRLTTLNGQAQATTRWIVTLRPRHSGTVQVPALHLGGGTTQPIELHVLKAEDAAAVQKLAPVFIDASLDQEEVYVQAQAILTLRIYHSVSLYDDSSLSPLQIDDAKVEQLGQARTYEKEINGVRHGVIEVRYAIFPQHSGELSIPAQSFTATQVARANPGDSFGARPGKRLRVTSPEIPLQVKPKPADYPADLPWLPARALSLSESWTPQPDQAKAGESLTRNLMLRVEGLSSAQLPPLPQSLPAGLRHYPDQPQLAEQQGDQGVIGSREEREALVPDQAGQLTLPDIEVTWWNTQEDRLERTSLPGRTLSVAANPQLDAQERPAALDGAPVEGAARLWPWQLATLLLALTTLLGFGLWWHARRQPAIIRAAANAPNARTLLDELKRCCLANDSHATRQALDAWARQQPETLADMAARFVPLSDAMDGLNGALYSDSEGGSNWQGDDLWRAIRALPTAEAAPGASAEGGSLPPLYPR